MIVLVVMSAAIADDPTRPDVIQPAAKAKAVKINYHLSMIRLAEDKPTATINGKQYQVGDTLGAYRINRITAKQVILSNNKGQLKLNLITNGALRKSS